MTKMKMPQAFTPEPDRYLGLFARPRGQGKVLILGTSVVMPINFLKSETI